MALGQTDYGLYGLVGGLTIFISFFNNVLAGANARFYAFSIGEARVSFDKSAALEECRRWFNTALSMHLFVPVVLIVLGYPLGVYAIEHWLTIPADRVEASVWVFRFACLTCFVAMFNVPFAAMYTAKQYIAELTIYSFVTSTLNVIFLYYMVTHAGTWLTVFAFWTCLLSVVPQIIICIRACIIFPECRIVTCYMWDKARIKRIWSFGCIQMIGGFCDLLRTHGMSIVINKFFGPKMNAAQSIGNTVQAHCMTLAGAMQSAFVPVITQACGAKEYERMNKFAIRTFKFNVLLSLIFVIPLALELPEVMRLWLKNPPDCSVGLCYCAMVFHLANASSVGHMVVLNAFGKIFAYNTILSSMNVFAVVLAVCVGLVWRNVYIIMSVIVFAMMLNSLGRALFARYYVGTRLKTWLLEALVPLVIVTAITGGIGWLPHLFMVESFNRIIVTTILCEGGFIPLTWFVLLSHEERDFVREKIFRKVTLVLE